MFQWLGRKGERSTATIGIIELSGSIGKLSCSPWSQDSSHLQEYNIFGRGSLLSLHLPLFLLIFVCSFFRGWVIEWNLTDFSDQWKLQYRELDSCWLREIHRQHQFLQFPAYRHWSFGFCFDSSGMFIYRTTICSCAFFLQIGISLRRLQLKDSQVQNLAVFHKWGNVMTPSVIGW